MDHRTDRTPVLQGLSETEAQARLAKDGFNELPRSRRRSWLYITGEVLREPMLLLLVGGGVVYLLLGNGDEALILLAFACLSIGITVVQEARTEKVLEALRDLASPRALVLRAGQRKRVAGREIVRGDLILLNEGDRVPADARLIECTDLSADESLLTGEAIPVRKIAAGLDARTYRPGGEDLPVVFSGSLIVRGSALGEVTATGPASEIGKIGTSLGGLEIETPHLQRQMRTLVMALGIVGATVCLAVVVLFGLTRGNWLDATLAGIAVGMSMLPEEFPMVLAVFMAMGAWRISKARVLTRRAAAIEALGAASVLCTDKTGTLTENRMKIVELMLSTGKRQRVDIGPLSPPFYDLVLTGTLASAPRPIDPMEKAFHDLVQRDETWSLVRSYPLARELLAMTQVWQSGTILTAAAKGAPEAIASLCQLESAARASIAAQVDEMAKAGLRVLGVAMAEAGSPLPGKQADFDFRFLGLVGLSDPLRASVPAAVAECRAAGIRVIMITGDYPATAKAIARDAGLSGDLVLTGAELETADDRTLATAVRTTTIFARIMPEQKLRIVNALKANGSIVAMTGDGVNDAPSLKAAHIGVAMGGRGTDVAREAASIVLLDDDFGSIVTTIRLGRRIYANLRKAMSFILAVHVPIAGLALMPLLLGMPLLFAPVHIAFLEMVIDPVCSLVFEAERTEEGVMRQKPRPVTEPLFSGPMILWSLMQGGLALGATAIVYWFSAGYGLDEFQVRALTFASLIFAIIALILINRSASSSPVAAIVRPNRALAFVLPVIGVAMGVTMFWQPASALFRFGALEGFLLAVPPLTGISIMLILELLKSLWRLTAHHDPLAPATGGAPSSKIDGA
ncbi:cation-translocating P-type ATPase [Labrys sp. ZIDIC5]|uniref:cation-translocating P-type ATPase n=1 Tax=Labrys sedimenti TaxID=3106036 RepID=UPI002ACAD205|nr:cation-translocating P-type ATPase [Labrys sp. ZIDIC5]MDZ5454452.1 cation-translocating P-type ATPase [Labrys sp. ZIDIC5]